jgi:hypothetical protein
MLPASFLEKITANRDSIVAEYGQTFYDQLIADELPRQIVLKIMVSLKTK